MNTTQTIISFLIFVVGMLVGWILTYANTKRQIVGTLREDRSDPDEPPYLFLELEADGMTRIQSHRLVTLRVLRENYISAPNTSASMESTPHN